MTTPIPPWTQRDNFSKSRHQELVDAINGTGLTTGAGGLEILRTPGGQTISGPLAGKIDEIFMGKVVTAGPNGEGDYSDERYWLRKREITVASSDDETARVTIADDDSPDGELIGEDDSGGDDEGQPIAETIVTATSVVERLAGTHTLQPDDEVLVIGVYGRFGADGIVKRYLFWITSGTSTSVLRIGSAYGGRGWYGASICAKPSPYEWRPNIVMGVDTTTTYTNGVAFTNGDYAKNLSNNTVYHRVAGAWTIAAGHLATSDADVTTDLTTQKTTFIPTGPAASVIAANLFEATTGNDAGLVSPLASGELCLGIPWFTQSNGTQVYVITGRFRMIDGSNYMHPQFNAGQWTPDWPKAH